MKSGIAFCLLVLLLPLSLISQHTNFEVGVWTSAKQNFHQFNSIINDKEYQDEDWYQNNLHFHYGLGLSYILSEKHSLRLGIELLKFGYSDVLQSIHPYYGFIMSPYSERQYTFEATSLILDYSFTISQNGRFKYFANVGARTSFVSSFYIINTKTSGEEIRSDPDNFEHLLKSPIMSCFAGAGINYKVYDRWWLELNPMLEYETGQNYIDKKATDKFGLNVRVGVKFKI